MRATHVVFLQGMPSAFYRTVADRLAAQGCGVTAIALCPGDGLFWAGSGHPLLHYRGRYRDWPAFIARLLETTGASDLVLLGEQRRYHKEAVAIARQRGVRVVVTDFGYLRPDWITLERDGMNGDSRFPKRADLIAALAAASPEPDTAVRYRDGNAAMSIRDTAYLLANALLFWLYPGYRRADNRPHPFVYLPASTLRDLSSKLKRKRHAARLAAFLASGRRYFVFPLQIEHDFQIVAYSPFGDLSEAIGLVIRSFAAHAGPDTALLIKPHPWDPGFRNWESRIRRMAETEGIGERVVFVDGGDLDAMTRGAAGMVTVNSTSGLGALRLGKPLVALGEAIYDMPGLTFQDGLDRFWTEGCAPEPALVAAFFRAMAGTVLVRGTFFTEPGLSAGAAEAARRILAGTVGVPDLG